MKCSLLKKRAKLLIELGELRRFELVAPTVVQSLSQTTLEQPGRLAARC